MFARPRDSQRRTTATETEDTKALADVIRIDENAVKDHLGELVRGSVEETLNGLFWTPRPTVCAKRAATSAPRSGGTPGRAATSACCRQRPGR
jgi:hypothetical protein